MHFRAWKVEIKNHPQPYLARAVLNAFWLELTFLGLLGFFTNFVTNLGSAIVLEAFLSFFQYVILISYRNYTFVSSLEQFSLNMNGHWTLFTSVC